MWHIADSRPDPPEDQAHALAAINQQTAFFDPGSALTLARAPGRLDLMGGIADYSGALVLQLPLAIATWVAAQAVDEPVLHIRSLDVAATGGAAEVAIPLTALLPRERALSYAEARALLTEDAGHGWTTYVAGVLAVLRREEGVELEQGLRLLIYSEVPVGKGVSSSAALEVATMQAVCGVLGLRLPARRVALLCQLVENMVVGAPCGVMDQMTAACGEQGRLLALLCQPAEIQPSVPLPAEVTVWGIDSGVRHAVVGGDYGAVRVGAFMGYRILAELAGLPIAVLGPGRVQAADPLWQGYLCNVEPAVWEMHYRAQVPETIQGAEFLQRYGGSTDSVTHIEPERVYPVRQPTAHPIYKHYRVRLFRALVEHPALDDERLRLMGELMYQSHASYSACGLGSAGTDRLVALVRAAGPAVGLYGAKITGGGSGGTVAVLAHRDAAVALQEVARQYSTEVGHEVAVLGGSSPGAQQFGVLRAVYT